ncbi:hypothetical protein KI387_012493, partial [Taxus chinensis]
TQKCGCANLGYLGLDRDFKHWIPARIIERFEGCYRSPTDVGICSIADHCRDLRKVYLKRRKGLGNVGVTALMNLCPNITHLDLGFCNKVTNRALEAIGASRCLETLVLDGCRLVTGEELASLVSGSTATTLKRLDLCQCNRITDLGITLLQQLSCLQVLNLAGCGPR